MAVTSAAGDRRHGGISFKTKKEDDEEEAEAVAVLLHGAKFGASVGWCCLLSERHLELGVHLRSQWELQVFYLKADWCKVSWGFWGFGGPCFQKGISNLHNCDFKWVLRVLYLKMGTAYYRYDRQHKFLASVGFGGHCFEKDILNLILSCAQLRVGSAQTLGLVQSSMGLLWASMFSFQEYTLN